MKVLEIMTSHYPAIVQVGEAPSATRDMVRLTIAQDGSTETIFLTEEEAEALAKNICEILNLVNASNLQAEALTKNICEILNLANASNLHRK